MSASKLISLSLAAGLVGCAVTEPDQETAIITDLERAAPRPQLIQRGAALNVLGVVGDRTAIYQDGARLYATALTAGAPRALLSDTTVTNAQVLTFGDVALIWPDQAAQSTITPGRLLVWTQATGARVASSRSVAPSTTAYFPGIAVSRDGSSVMFIDNLDADATRGDIVIASPGLRNRVTVAHQVNVDYASSACPPILMFSVDRGETIGHAVFCAGDSTTATLVNVACGEPREVATGLFAPPAAMARDGIVTATDTNRFPIQIDRDGTVTQLDDHRTGFVFRTATKRTYAVSRIETGVVLQTIDPASGVRTTVIPPPVTRVFESHAPLGLPHHSDEYVSSDSKLAMYSTATDPATGLGNVNLADIRYAPVTPVTLEPQALCGQQFEIFTRDASHALYYCFDVAANTSSLFAGSLDTPARQLSRGNAYQHFAGAGRTVILGDNLDAAAVPATFDLRVLDVLDPDHATTLVTGASVNFVPTADRQRVVYALNRASEPAGLYVSRVR